MRRLAARARSKDAVLVPFGASWPGADVRLRAEAGPWSGIGSGNGRLRARRVEVTAEGRGSAARPRSATLWLPADAGGVRHRRAAGRPRHRPGRLAMAPVQPWFPR